MSSLILYDSQNWYEAHFKCKADGGGLFMDTDEFFDKLETLSQAYFQ